MFVSVAMMKLETISNVESRICIHASQPLLLLFYFKNPSVIFYTIAAHIGVTYCFYLTHKNGERKIKIPDKCGALSKKTIQRYSGKIQHLHIHMYIANDLYIK
jgi:hypothetical protein